MAASTNPLPLLIFISILIVLNHNNICQNSLCELVSEIEKYTLKEFLQS